MSANKRNTWPLGMIQYDNLRARLTAEQLIRESEERERQSILKSLQRNFEREDAETLRRRYLRNRYLNYALWVLVFVISMGICVLVSVR